MATGANELAPPPGGPPAGGPPTAPAGGPESPPAMAPSRWVLIPPPPLFLFPLMLGLRLGRIVPLPLPSAALTHPAHLAGIVAVATGVALMVSAPLLFLLRRTTIIPHGDARAMITDGPYRVTRNPMYLGLTVVYLGVALLRTSIWPLLFLPFPLWVLQTKTIPFEEAALTRLFGDAYRTYRQRVRRWI